MTGSADKTTASYRFNNPVPPTGYHVSELIAEAAGSMSPFGEDVEFPLPYETLGYVHPGRAERPNLAGD
ncbi:MAG TPA: hypothetical protein VK816_11800 [Jatrophihabitantaceae bacterium]|jgi:hypothetical protein|nr:hypothetical protein [Jatrophihabitantaceae bacterium]